MIALVDCNSFFCSCERVFNPKLRYKPVVVLSNNDGCVVARTDEAKKAGILMGEPFFQARSKIEKYNVQVFSSNFPLYGDMSKRVMRTLSEFTPHMEVYSIDEAFLSFEGVNNKSIESLGVQIKETVYQHTGIPVSLGIAPTKVLCKVANEYAKKNKEKTEGVVCLSDEKEIDFILKNMDVSEVWGIGFKSAQKLKSLNIHTAFDLKKSNEKLIQKYLSIVGRRIVRELNGESCLHIETDFSAKKQIISSRSFGKPITELSDIQESVASHVSQAAEKLRKQKSVAGGLAVFIRTSPFQQTQQYRNSYAIPFLSKISSTNKMIKYAFEALDIIFKKNYLYKKAGVVLFDISSKQNSQLDFFQSHDQVKDDALMSAIDKVNLKEGSETLKFAACGINKHWKMLSQMKSPCYSSRWSELLEVGDSELKTVVSK